MLGELHPMAVLGRLCWEGLSGGLIRLVSAGGLIGVTQPIIL